MHIKLLIVDDEVLAVEGLLKNLEACKYYFGEIYTANSKKKAIEVLECHEVDLILCDIEMPDGNGLELLNWVQEHHPEILSIILSCHDEFRYAQRAVQLSCFDYILKPATPDMLVAVMEKAYQRLLCQDKDQRMKEMGESYVHKISDYAEERTDDIRKVSDYIMAHIAEELSVEKLAAMVYLSPNYLTRCFKREYKKTVSEYIIDLRLSLAAEMLVKKDLSVAIVAAKVGYPSYTYFTKIFKKRYGMSPVKYRSVHVEKGKSER